MKKILSRLFAPAAIGIAILGSSSSANAQYAQIVNQIPELLSPALSGSMNYRGFVDATATFGIGNDRANFIGVSTTQGFQYASWFFMGVGIGVDVATSSTSDRYTSLRPDPGYGPSMARTKAMIPLFSDFRFNFGSNSNASFYADIKAGAAWLLGNSFLELNNGSLSTRTQFILRPSIGVRIPVNKQKPKQAVNIGVTYQLITANNSWGYWNNSYYDTTLNSLGVNVGYEW
ncbi:MAG: YdgA family protein [Muribaculaceae bacterium]|nr:YdgA family protein [Muribaculaceae bacterium]